MKGLTLKGEVVSLNQENLELLICKWALNQDIALEVGRNEALIGQVEAKIVGVNEEAHLGSHSILAIT